MKFETGARVKIVGDHVCRGRLATVRDVDQRGAYVVIDGQPNVGYYAAWSQMKPPPSPVPTKGSIRANQICPKCGKKRNACECLERKLMDDLAALGVHVLAENREYQFGADDGRRWRADFAWPYRRLLVEVEGGSSVSRHRSREGYSRDLEKYNYMTLHGWRVLRYDTGMVTTGHAAREIAALLTGSSSDVRLPEDIRQG